MTTLTSNPGEVRPFSSALRRILSVSAPAILLLLFGASLSAAPALEMAAFPDAIRIRPGPVLVGPEPSAGATLLTPNDLIGLDGGYQNSSTHGAILNFSTANGGNGAATVLASSAVGSGTTYANTTTLLTAVAPNGIVYSLQNHTVGSTAYADFIAVNPTTKVRTLISDGSNPVLGPVATVVQGMTWDFRTGTLLYLDQTNTQEGSGAGVYRMDPATGLRSVISTNGSGSGYVVTVPSYPTTDAFGNIFYLDTDTPSTTTVGHIRAIVRVPVVANSFTGGYPAYGARTVVSSNTVGSQTGGTYQDLIGLWIDTSQPQTLTGGLPGAQSLIVDDEGTTQTNSALYRVPSDTGAKAKLISFNSTNANTGTSVFDLPASAVADTTGRAYYEEFHTGSALLTVVPAGTHAAAALAGATALSVNPFPLNVVPPPTPVLAAGTSSNVLGTTATLNSNITADGGSAQSPVTANAGVISRGFVYAQTSANAAPKIGGTGVTVVTNFAVTSLPVATGTSLGAFSSSISGLSQGTSYTFTAFAQDQAGYTYTTPVAFSTAALPVVGSPTATAITGTSATLGGTVSGDGGAPLTARGVVYAKTSNNTNPIIGATGVTTITDPTATAGTFADGTGSVLAVGTNYTYRAFATNAVGTAYSVTSSFTTAAAPTATAQAVTVAFNTAKAITLTGTDPNSPPQTLTYTVATAPAHGTLSGTAPNLTYTPAANYQGADSFTFTVTNTASITSTAATVSITVVGEPFITSFAPASGPVGTSVTINGSQFTGATGVTFFRNVAGTNFTLVSDTQITVTVPAGATTGTLRVNTTSGSGTSSTKFQVTN